MLNSPNLLGLMSMKKTCIFCICLVSY